MSRLTGALCDALGLDATRGAADIQLSLRRPPDGSAGWQVLVRLGSRPLTARPWRVCDMRGALDASVAAVMVQIAGPAEADRLLNLACGSGTLLVERLRRGPAALAIGVDLECGALTCARANLIAAGLRSRAALIRGDACHLPLAVGTVDKIVCDLPFGMAVGSPPANARLYPALVAEAARVAAPGGRLVVITAARRLFEQAIATRPEWHPMERIPLRLPTRGAAICPCIYVYVRTTRPPGQSRPSRI